MKKNRKKICIYQKKAVSLHRQMKKTPIQHQLLTQKKQNYEQSLLHQKLRRNPTDVGNN